MHRKGLQKNPNEPTVPALHNVEAIARIVGILEEVHSHVGRTVNNSMVVAYRLIGLEIAEEEQTGQNRADHGRALMKICQGGLRDALGREMTVLWPVAANWNFRPRRSCAVFLWNGVPGAKKTSYEQSHYGSNAGHAGCKPGTSGAAPSPYAGPVYQRWCS